MTQAPIVLGCWVTQDASAPYPKFADARAGSMPAHCGGLLVVVEEEGDAALDVLRAGAMMAFVSAASEKAPERIERLARQSESGRIGAFVDAAPMEVRWHMDTESNADFRTLVPSMPEACWELLDAKGERTAIRVDHWLARLFDHGATAAVVRVDLAQARDRDLNVCAGLVERFGTRVWIAPGDAHPCSLEPWIRHGHASRFVLPADWHAAVLAEQAAEVSHAA